MFKKLSLKALCLLILGFFLINITFSTLPDKSGGCLISLNKGQEQSVLAVVGPQASTALLAGRITDNLPLQTGVVAGISVNQTKPSRLQNIILRSNTRIIMPIINVLRSILNASYLVVPM